MHLVLITQKIDASDNVRAFTAHWLRSFARRVDHVSCIALVGDFLEPPKNVGLHSLGKQRQTRQWRLALALRHQLAGVCSESPVDAIFAHMAPLYAVRGVEPATARRHGIPVYLWYIHRMIDIWMRLATAISKRFTASVFHFETAKRRVMGHGIPRDPFETDEREILAVCRVSPVKTLDTPLRAPSLLFHASARMRIVGDETVASDRAELDALIDLGTKERIGCDGAVRYGEIAPYYRRSLMTVDPCDEGFDKAVLESMANGRPSLTGNPAFATLFGDDASALVYVSRDPRELAS